MSELSEFGIAELIRLFREEPLTQLLKTQLKRPAKKKLAREAEARRAVAAAEAAAVLDREPLVAAG